MEFRLLGPVEVSTGERRVALGGSKPRNLFAALLVDHGRVVPTSRLVDAVWGAAPPPTARGVVQTYVSTLRQSLAGAGGAAEILTRPPGYLLRIQPDALDRDRFERLYAQGRQAAATARYDRAAELLRAAAAQWRGDALGGVDSELLSGEAARLDELRLAAVAERIGADLALGRVAAACAELTDLVRRHPYHERFHGLLMTALCRLGRRSEALARYRAFRDTLVEELGIEPGAELRRVHEAALRDDPDPPGPARPGPPSLNRASHNRRPRAIRHENATMDEVVAVEVRLADGSARYFVTWGRIQHPVDPRPLCDLILRVSRSFGLGGDPVEARVCASMREAAASPDAPYFYECYLRFCQTRIPYGEGYERWRAGVDAAMRAGGEISYCGRPVTSEAA